MILLGSITGTHLMIYRAVGIGKSNKLNVATTYLSIGEGLVAGVSLLISLILLFAAPVAIRLIAPDGIERITFKLTYSSSPDNISTIVLNKFVLRVTKVEGYLISEVANAVVPLYLELPSPGLQLTNVYCRHIDTDGMRQLEI